jgi:hypothetical protein
MCCKDKNKLKFCLNVWNVGNCDFSKSKSMSTNPNSTNKNVKIASAGCHFVYLLKNLNLYTYDMKI